MVIFNNHKIAISVLAIVLLSVVYAGAAIVPSDSASQKITNTAVFQHRAGATNFKAYSNISIRKNTHLKFIGAAFYGKHVFGNGILHLDGAELNLELSEVSNLFINATETTLSTNLIILNKLEINRNSKLILQQCILYIKQQAYENAICNIFVGRGAKVIIVDDDKLFPKNSFAIMGYNYQSNYNKTTSLYSNNQINIAVRSINSYNIVMANLYKYIMPTPPSPPPEQSV